MDKVSLEVLLILRPGVVLVLPHPDVRSCCLTPKSDSARCRVAAIIFGSGPGNMLSPCSELNEPPPLLPCI